jgi:hypothetical protein
VNGLLAPVRPAFRAIAQAMVPAAQRYDEATWGAMEATVEGALAPRPMAMQRQFVTFLRLANLLAVPMRGRTLVGLPVAERERVLHALERAPVALVRRGVWGVRTLVFMGHYAVIQSPAVILSAAKDPLGGSGEAR